MEENNLENETVTSQEKELGQLIFKYGIDLEEARVKETLGEADFYRQKGYKVKLPDGLSLDEALVRSPKEMELLIIKEYDPSIYELARNQILLGWKAKFEVLQKGLGSLGLKPDDKYEVRLTRYGTGGSYRYNSSPKKVIVNLEGKKRHLPAEIICHEIIHLCIQGWINKYKYEDLDLHWSKEHIVDLIMKEIFNDGFKQAVDSKLAAQIDAIFEKNKTNIEEVVKQVGAL